MNDASPRNADDGYGCGRSLPWLDAAGARLQHQPPGDGRSRGLRRLPSATSSSDAGDASGENGRSELPFGGGGPLARPENVQHGEHQEQEQQQQQQQQQQPGWPSMPPSLLAAIKATRVREIVLREVIEKNGGRKGMEGLVRAIVFWLKEKCRSASQPGPEERGNHGLAMPLPATDAPESTPAVDTSSGNSGDALPLDMLCGPVADWDDSDIDSCLRAGLTSDDTSEGWLSGLWCPLLSESTFPVNCASLLCDGSAKNYEAAGVETALRKRSPSPVVDGFDEILPPPNKAWRHSPPPPLLSSGMCILASGEMSVYGGGGAAAASAVPLSAIWGTPGNCGAMEASPDAPGGPFDLNFVCPLPMDPLPADFVAFDLQGPILIEESASMPFEARCGLADGVGLLSGRIGLSIENSASSDRKKSSGRRSESLFKSTGGPAASTRAVRKMRLDRHRRTASASSRAKRPHPVPAGTKGGDTRSPDAWRVSCPPKDSSASAWRPAKHRPKLRNDQKHLQFLLQKILTASDVGSLGRMVLPKKDAEENLPWLETGEKLQLVCEDYDTAREMNLGFRFWPNNGSRMYLIEKTGDFVADHCLREADTMILYKNLQRGNYVIRAMKGPDYAYRFLRKGQSGRENRDGRETSEKEFRGSASENGNSFLDTSVDILKSTGTGGPEAPALLPNEAVLKSDAFSKSEDDFLEVVTASIGGEWENLASFASLESSDPEFLERIRTGSRALRLPTES